MIENSSMYNTVLQEDYEANSNSVRDSTHSIFCVVRFAGKNECTRDGAV